VLVSVTCGANDPNSAEQKAYHLWAPEPQLATAIACRDNDVGFERPEDPNRDQPVPLPNVVRESIRDLTRRTFAERLYEGPTLYADLFGPVYRLKLPDRDALYLYVFQLKDHPTLAFRWYRIVLVLQDAKSGLVSSSLAIARTDYQPYCPRPWVRFEDVIGDEVTEVLLLKGHHRGTDANHILLPILRIGEDLVLHGVLSLRTGIFMPLEDLGEGRGSFAVRTIQKADPTRLDVTVTLSKTKLAMGSKILGYETWEMGEDGRVQRTTRTVIPDQPYDYVFAIERGRVESMRN
jgi:hypothetical protein